MNAKLSVIIVNYNNIKDTIECIESVLASSYKNFNIILVDNGSKEEVYNTLKQRFNGYEKVILVRSERNGGYGYGNNIGIKYAEKLGSNYFLILNNDVIIEPSTIEKLIVHIESNTSIGIVFPVIFLHKNKKENQTNSIGGEFCVFGFSNDKGFNEDYSDIKNEINNKFFYAPGSCFLITSRVLKEVNYFDENIFLYWDDVDISWRVRLLNHKIHIVKNAFAFHKLSVSTGKKKNPFKVYHREFSSLYVLTKNLSLKLLLLLLPIYFSLCFTKVIYSIVRKDILKATISAYIYFFKNLNKCFEARKQVQKSRKVSDKEIFRYQSFRPIFRIIKYMVR